MSRKVDLKISVIVPNWNGKDSLTDCLDSLLLQSQLCRIIVIENGSTDGSLEYMKETYPGISLIINKKNLGFAGGVNSGIRKAIEEGSIYVALFNNDAVADKDWLKNLVTALNNNKEAGIVACKFIDSSKSHLDSTGEGYSVWGLPYPRGRGELVDIRYDNLNDIFAASGGASLYRVKMLDEIGLFDEDFFAYYEDVDLSFRAQLTGWKVLYEPKAEAYHQIGMTSSKIKGFTTYQTLKNLPWVYIKNVPTKYLLIIGLRFWLAYYSFVLSALSRAQIWPIVKSFFVTLWLTPKKLLERQVIQKQKKVPDEYIWNIITHDLPPNATNLRVLRSKYWQIKGKGSNEKNRNRC